MHPQISNFICFNITHVFSADVSRFNVRSILLDFKSNIQCYTRNAWAFAGLCYCSVSLMVLIHHQLMAKSKHVKT